MITRSVVFVLLFLCSQVVAQSDPVTQEEQAAFKEYYRQRATEIQFAPGAEPPIQLAKAAAQSWSMQDRDNFLSGEVFVWERHGRPEVIGCIGSLSGGERRRGVFQEYHNLSRQKLPKSRLTVYPGGVKTEYDWSPPALVMKPVNTTMEPAKIAPARLLQFRKLAESFEIELGVHTYEDGKRSLDYERLRRLPQPIYRYDSKKLAAANSDVVDGAIFAYVWTKGTDPECLLSLECRRKSETTSWHYAPVRFGYRPLRMARDGTELWDNDGQGNGIERNSIYFTNSGGDFTIDEIVDKVANVTKPEKEE